MSEGSLKMSDISLDEIASVKRQWIIENTLIGATAARAVLGCSVSTFNRMVDDREFSVYRRFPGRAGNPRMFRLVDVNRYIESLKMVDNYDD